MEQHQQGQRLLDTRRQSTDDLVSPLESVQDDDAAVDLERERQSAELEAEFARLPTTRDNSPHRSLSIHQQPEPDEGERPQESSIPRVGTPIEATHFWWYWDFAGATVAAICMVLVAVVLFEADEMALEAWPLAISPNTVVSVLTTVARTALLVPLGSSISQLKWRHILLQARPLEHLQLFDNASRGPWGSVLMIRHLLLQSKLACALALATILTLGISPSAQVILEYPLLYKELPHLDVAIGRADGYLSRGFLQRPNMDWKFTDPNPDLPAFQSQILHALAGSVSQPEFRCPLSANRCELEEFSTLAVCRSFRNVTDKTTRSCNDPDAPAQVCNYTIPLGDEPPGGENTYEASMKYYNHDAYENFPEKTAVLHTNFLPSEQPHGWIGQLVVVRHHDMHWESEHTPATPETFVADFRWCRKTYRGVIATDGLLDPDRERIEESLLSYDDTHLPDIGNPFWVDDMRTSDGADSYGLTRALTIELPNYLANLLQTEYAERRGSRPTIEPRATSPIQMEYIMYRTNMQDLTRNLEAVLTNQARSSDPGDNRNATLFTEGRAFGRVTFIRVRWQWFALPVGAVVLALALFVWTVLLTRHTPLLKDSLLAMLFYPLRGWAEDEIYVEGEQTGEKLQKLAGRLHGRMETDEGRYRIVRYEVPAKG